ncbi:short chain dehydrogenase domain-containing protein [Phthorimaea operculella]|nr:short chain dehydrogenase domain-containing protein [Phthorimaea operculella]
MYEVKDKVFLVTGGAAGIGAGVTKALLADGAKHVAVLDLDVASGKALETEQGTKYGAKKIKFYNCDITTKALEDAFDAVHKEFGYIDCVVNNAAIMNDAPNVYVKEIEINVTALIRSSMKAYNLMRKDHGGKGGTVINVASVAAIYRCIVTPIYGATKSAVLQFTNCMGMEPYYSRSGVRFLCLCFGVTDTSLLSKTKYGCIDKETDDDQIMEKLLRQLPPQKPESAVKGVLEAYRRGESASTWLITADKPAQDITKNIDKGYDIMGTGVFDA